MPFIKKFVRINIAFILLVFLIVDIEQNSYLQAAQILRAVEMMSHMVRNIGMTAVAIAECENQTYSSIARIFEEVKKKKLILQPFFTRNELEH